MHLDEVEVTPDDQVAAYVARLRWRRALEAAGYAVEPEGPEPERDTLPPPYDPFSWQTGSWD